MIIYFVSTEFTYRPMSLQVPNNAAVLFFIVGMFSLKKLSSPTAGIIYVYAQ